MANFETNDCLGIVHRTALYDPPKCGSRIDKNFVVTFLDLSPKSPIVEALFNRGIKNIADLRIGRGEISGINAWESPKVLSKATAPHISLSTAKPTYKALELYIKEQKFGLSFVQLWADDERAIHVSRLPFTT